MRDAILKEDISRILEDNRSLFGMLSGKTVLVTGATGLIGSALVKTLCALEDVNIIALVRNVEKAKQVFSGYEKSRLSFCKGDVLSRITLTEPVDYIVHGASQTASKAFVESPVETICTAIQGTLNLLEVAREKNVKGFVYLSSMEVYGTPTTRDKVAETDGVVLDTMAVRSSYPEAKRACESLCTAYAQEYGVPAKVARLTQTFGPGVRYDDGRVFAEFARCVIEHRDIVLKTKGETERCYLYLTDAVSAILTILLKGESGQAYNAANEATYCSILEMAQMVARLGDIQVQFDLAESAEKLGYAKTLCMNLDTQKLQTLGWQPGHNLEEMYQRMIEEMRRSK